VSSQKRAEHESSDEFWINGSPEAVQSLRIGNAEVHGVEDTRYRFYAAAIGGDSISGIFSVSGGLAGGRMGDRLAGKVAVITGGANGMGAAEARRFVTEDAQVVIVDRNDELGAQVAAELGGSATFQHLDVSDWEGWCTVVASVLAQFGAVDVLVNNAGVGASGSIDTLPLETHHQIIDVNLHGVYYGMRAVAAPMRKQRRGSIINISSVNGLAGMATRTTYTASKFAVTGMTRSAALELGPFGIRVNSIHPGMIETSGVTAEVIARWQP
jgi:3alpha(or 20beta)-hydroxysteroid dehydrogenase